MAGQKRLQKSKGQESTKKKQKMTNNSVRAQKTTETGKSKTAGGIFKKKKTITCFTLHLCVLNSYANNDMDMRSMYISQ